MFRLACADFTFPLLPHEVSVKLVGMMGFAGIDIGLFEGRSHLWPSREFRRVSKNARALKKKVSDAGLKVADVFLQMAPDFVPYAINHPQASRRRKARDWFERTLEYAQVCGSDHVTTLPGVRFSDEPASASRGRCIEELAWRHEKAKSMGLVFGFEAHVGSIVPRPKAALELLKKLPGVGLTLDYTHFARIGLPDRAVEPLLRYANHFHVRGARKGRLQARFADNVIDYGRIMRLLQQRRYRGWVGVEYVWIDWEHCNECDNVAETVLFRNFLRGVG